MQLRLQIVSIQYRALKKALKIKPQDKMKTTLLAAFMALGIVGFAQDNWSIGLRLGDPTGFTAKKYMGNNAIEFNVGRSYSFSGRGLPNNGFSSWHGQQNFNHQSFQYVNHRNSSAFGVQVHYLFHNRLDNVFELETPGLDWYWGLGGQARMQNYTYEYKYKIDGDPNWHYETDAQVADYDLGVDGVIGLEYTFAYLPISVFTDMTLFVELIDDPFMFHFQGGLGGRYNF
jgi:hypothetical protein